MRVTRLLPLVLLLTVMTFGVNAEEVVAFGEHWADLPIALIAWDDTMRSVLHTPGAVSLLASSGVGLWVVMQRRLRSRL